MKILGIILAILMLGLSILVGTLATNKSFKAAKDIAAATELMSGMSDEMKAAASKEVGDIPSAGRFKAGGVVGGLAAGAALVLLIVTFVKKPAVKIVGAAAVALAAIAAVLYPSIPGSEMGGLAPRPQELIALGMAVVGAGGAFLAARQRERAV